MGDIAQNRILYLQYANPAHYPPLEHSSKILAGRNWSVLFLGIRRLEEDPVVFREFPGVKVREFSGGAAGWRQRLNYAPFFLWVVVLALAWRPGWVYASNPASCPVALALSWLLGARVLYHEHDPPLAGSSFSGTLLVARRWVAQRAAACVFPSQERLEEFRAALKPRGRLFCVWNCPEVAEASAEQEVPVPPGGPLRLYYHGTLVPQRLPLSVIRAVGSMPKRVRLRVVGFDTLGARGYRQALQEEARRVGAQESVEVTGPMMNRGELFKQMAGCDVGFSCMLLSGKRPDLRSIYRTSCKTSEYLAVGMALLVPDQPEWVEAFVRPGYGLSCDPEDPQSIRRALEWFLEHREETRRMGEKGRRMVLSEWNYERQFPPVVQVLEKVRRG